VEVGAQEGRVVPSDGGDIFTKAAHLVMPAMRSMRTWLWMSEASWGDTWAVLVTRGRGGGYAGVGRDRVSVSSSTLTKLLMVSRTSLMLNGVAWVSLWLSRRAGVAIVAMVKLRNLQVNHHPLRGWWW
jgi:hypothetical protein